MTPDPRSADAVSRPDGRIARLDRSLSRGLAVGWPHPAWVRLPLGAFSLSANYGILWYAVCLLPWLLGEPRPWQKALYVAVPVTLVEWIGYGVKRLVARPRPPVADPTQPRQIPLPPSKSFPSSHASMSVVGAFTVTAMYHAAWPAVAAVAVVLCFSRVYLGVHYLGDVVGGLALGLALGAAWVLLVPAPV